MSDTPQEDLTDIQKAKEDYEFFAKKMNERGYGIGAISKPSIDADGVLRIVTEMQLVRLKKETTDNAPITSRPTRRKTKKKASKRKR